MNDAAPAAHGMDVLSLVLQADPVVQGVMALLAVASIAVWAIVLEKAVLLARLRREAEGLAQFAAGGSLAPPEGEGLAARLVQAGLAERRDGRDPDETMGEYRGRLERAMRATLSATLRRAEPGLPLLASIGAVSPFIGLFGTVWGIMHSFSDIAARQDTSLATVAPGIAEALFATAIGLVAAIPAVLAYNRCSVKLSRIRQEAAAAVAVLAARLARRPSLAAAASRQMVAE